MIKTSNFSSHFIDNNGVKIHAVSQGEGPLVLMVHGFPGLAYSWRHQMRPLAEAGFQAVAIDCRGYGKSDRPSDPSAYDANVFTSDLLAVINYFGAEKAALIGQDFGAQHSWNLAVRRPERVVGVIGMVPYDMDLAGRALEGSKGITENSAAMAGNSIPPSERFAVMGKENFVHVHYFQQVGVPEKELGDEPYRLLQTLFWALSAEGDLLSAYTKPAAGNGYLDVLPAAPPLPWSWMSELEMNHFVEAFTHADPDKSFIGGLNSYRTADVNWRIGEKWADADVPVPAAVIVGEADPVLKVIDPAWQDKMASRCDDLRFIDFIPGAGHCVQQESPAATTASILNFLRGLDRWS
ncbi:MAG: alpha/beta hydrolase [Thauera sp.]|nr:alpha/beta hydrolase [Thauera sp.]